MRLPSLIDEQKSYLRGKRYIAEKNVQGGDHRSKGQNDPLVDTADRLAKDYNVAPKTIKRDAAFARAVDKIEKTAPYVLSANLHRRHMTASQKSIAAGKAHKLIEKLTADALKQKKEGGKKAGRGRPRKDEVTLPHPNRNPQTRDQLGKLMGISGTMVDRGRKVAEGEQ